MSQRAAVLRPDLDADGAEIHPWVAKARAIDRAFGGGDLSAETLARYVRIVKIATADARPAGQGRTLGARAGRAGRRVVR